MQASSPTSMIIRLATARSAAQNAYTSAVRFHISCHSADHHRDIAGYIGYAGQRNHYGRRRALRLQLEVVSDDGSRATACSTDDGWRWTNMGPVREADFLMGETYDARRWVTSVR